MMPRAANRHQTAKVAMPRGKLLPESSLVVTRRMRMQNADCWMSQAPVFSEVMCGAAFGPRRPNSYIGRVRAAVQIRPGAVARNVARAGARRGWRKPFGMEAFDTLGER
jgi:hypothetical protein